MSSDAPLNGKLEQAVVMNTATMDWVASPSGTVWRKRVHRVGPMESGQVTSVVRYQPAARFPAHDHPEGEEILVLEGVFSDEHGDWEAGTYLLNPEGFHHAPFSVEGCTLLVKLRQYPGRDRQQMQLRTQDQPWTQTDSPGRCCKLLYQQEGFSDRTRLESWSSDCGPISLNWTEGAELFVIRGEFSDENDCYPSGSWLRLPPGSQHTANTASGCELFIKEGGFPYLRHGSAR